MAQGGIISSTRASVTDIAKKAARQVAEEPVEILKTGTEQALGGQVIKDLPREEDKAKEAEKSKDFDQERRAREDARFMKALEAEIADIRRSRDQEKLLAKRKEEEEKARIARQSASQELPTVSSKPSRRLGGWVKGLSKGIETRKPPTG